MMPGSHRRLELLALPQARRPPQWAACHYLAACSLMPDVTAGSLSIAFGNFQLAYVIVDKAGIRFLRDPFTDKRNLLFYAYRRCGGSLANSEAIKLMKTDTS